MSRLRNVDSKNDLGRFRNVDLKKDLGRFRNVDLKKDLSRFNNFNLKNNNRKRIIFFSMLIFVSITGIFVNETHKNEISKVESYNNEFAKIKIASGSKVILSSENNGSSNSEHVQNGREYNNKNDIIFENKNKDDIVFENKNTVHLKTEDTAIPNNVDKIETKVIEDTMLINFEKPKDNGTSYSYLIKNDKKNTKEKNYNFYSESGIKGYCYDINNNAENVVKTELNKLDESPLVLQQIDWNKNYYLHIKTIDNNLNESNCNTIRLKLPSQGLRIRYIDLNTNNELCNSYKMEGNANDEYDISDKIKNIQGYKLITKKGETNGKLKKDQINIDAFYAKSKNLTIKYIDEEANKEIKGSDKLDCYIGQKVDINKPTIIGYECKSGKLTYVVNDSEAENVVKVYYNKIKIPESDANIKYDKDADMKNGTVNSKNANKENESKETQEKKASQNRNIKIKYVDFDTNKILFEETKILKPDEKKIKLKMYYIEGYSKMSNEKNEYNNHSEEEKTIMDELRESIVGKENAENVTHQDENNLIDNIPSKQEYEILMNCDQSDYIIYYKKQ